MARSLEFASAAGPDAFVVQRFSGREALGRLPEYKLELLSKRADLTADLLLGTNATMALEGEGDAMSRWFNGYFSSFTVRGPVRTPAFGGEVGYLYLATLHPALWFLSRRADCRVFRDVTLGDLLAGRMADGVPMAIQNDLGPTEHREQVVQYRETDLDFVTRLAEHIGASWLFVHQNGAHRLVLTDRPGTTSTDEPTPVLRPTDAHGTPTLLTFELSREVQAGVWSGSDRHDVTPRTSLAVTHAQPQSHDNAGFEWFDAPIGTTQRANAEAYARVRMEEIACRHATARGVTVDHRVRVGFPVSIEHHPVGSLDGRWLVTAQSFTATNNFAQTSGGVGATFRAEFEAIPAGVPFRPARITSRPQIAGTQPARVVADFRDDVAAGGGDAGPIGERLARVRVAFFWDRRAEASCWARVAQPWAGKGFGFQNMPRLGDEVLVQFIEGDPDRPVVVGRVYNGDARPPYALPRHAAVTGLKTASIDARGATVPGRFNELRFDDTDGAEQVYVQAQRDLDERVLRHRRVWTGGAHHLVVAGDAFETCRSDRHLRVDGDANVSLGGSSSTTVERDVHLVATRGRIAVEAAGEIHVNAGVQLVLEAGARLTLKVGTSFIELDEAGVRIDGPFVALKSGGTPGQGSGASPGVAREAAEAMHSDGEARAPAAVRPVARPSFAPQASSYRIATETAAPFCAACGGC
jgi:type VI secretion system secreted protein VgrG